MEGTETLNLMGFYHHFAQSLIIFLGFTTLVYFYIHEYLRKKIIQAARKFRHKCRGIVNIKYDLYSLELSIEIKNVRTAFKEMKYIRRKLRHFKFETESELPVGKLDNLIHKTDHISRLIKYLEPAMYATQVSGILAFFWCVINLFSVQNCSDWYITFSNSGIVILSGISILIALYIFTVSFRNPGLNDFPLEATAD